MSNKSITRLIVGPVATNCWLYPLDEKTAAIIDPGDEADKIISALRQLNLCPVFILLTHGHFDHIAAVPELAKTFGKECEIAIHRLDSQYLGPESYAAHSISIEAAMGDSSFINSFWPADKRGMPPAGRLLEEGDAVGPFTVLHVPGHTPGSAAFWDKEEGVLFSGDTLFKGTWGRTDLPGGNEEEIMKSLKRLLAMDGNIEVYPGHDKPTTIGQETARQLV
jgi:glyoxylase-like metal-dependent hydrolase (beta-lactamase superfamily II)